MFVSRIFLQYSTSVRTVDTSPAQCLIPFVFPTTELGRTDLVCRRTTVFLHIILCTQFLTQTITITNPGQNQVKSRCPQLLLRTKMMLISNRILYQAFNR